MMQPSLNSNERYDDMWYPFGPMRREVTAIQVLEDLEKYYNFKHYKEWLTKDFLMQARILRNLYLIFKLMKKGGLPPVEWAELFPLKVGESTLSVGEYAANWICTGDFDKKEVKGIE